MADCPVLQCGPQLLGAVARLLLADAIEQYRELLTAQAHRHVQRPARRFLQHPRDLLQHVIAGLVAVAVVVGLEVVHIAEQQGQAVLFALGLAPQALELSIEAAAIVEAGETVVVRQHTHQVADEEVLAGLELQQVAAHGAGQVAEQQEQQVVDQPRHRHPGPDLQPHIGQ
ncbi:hypothetical protein FQZ97_805710 [compost metagenome]